MFEKLFVKMSDLVFHTIAPYSVEREGFLEHCCKEGFSKVALRRIAGIVVTAACDLHAHGGLDVDQKRLEAAAARIEVIRRQARIPDDARRISPRVSPCHDPLPAFVRLVRSYSRAAARFGWKTAAGSESSRLTSLPAPEPDKT